VTGRRHDEDSRKDLLGVAGGSAQNNHIVLFNSTYIPQAFIKGLLHTFRALPQKRQADNTHFRYEFNQVKIIGR
jgi:hypothetical protein